MSNCGLGVVALTGEPASGKSTVFRTLLSMLHERPVMFKSGLVNGFHYTVARITVLGSYDSTLQHPGTDKLSMAVQPDFNGLLQRWSLDPTRQGWVLLYEGDRLCNQASLNLIKELHLPFEGYALRADPATLATRHTARDNQNATWLAGRQTKVKRLVEEFGFTWLVNESTLDLLANAGRLLEAVKRVQGQLAQPT